MMNRHPYSQIHIYTHISSEIIAWQIIALGLRSKVSFTLGSLVQNQLGIPWLEFLFIKFVFCCNPKYWLGNSKLPGMSNYFQIPWTFLLNYQKRAQLRRDYTFTGQLIFILSFCGKCGFARSALKLQFAL